MERVTLHDLLAATGGQAAFCEPGTVEFRRVSTDSRTLQPGDLFWAIKGPRYDGHAFVAEAARKGAVACVVQEGPASSPSIPCAVVSDNLEALGHFARWHRRRMKAVVIGVTGSVGKTTAREMIYAVLSADFEGVRTAENHNNRVGLPLSMLSIEPCHEFAVLELGASKPGEIRTLAETALPDRGVVTRIGVGHLEGFGSIEAVAQAKGELVSALPESGVVVLNGDDPLCRALAGRARCRVVTVGTGAENTYRATSVEACGNELRFSVGESMFVVPAAGRHQLTAALAAVAIGREAGMRDTRIRVGLARFVAVPGRCVVHTAGTLTVIDDTYNANPTSVAAACELLADWNAAGQKILVLGEMAELGNSAAAWHEEIGRMAAAKGIDRLAALGPHADAVVRGARSAGMTSGQLAHIDQFGRLLPLLDCWATPGDVLLIKGSRCARMERVVERFVGRPEKTKENIGSRQATRACV